MRDYKLTFRQLQYMVAIAEHKNFHRAAQHCGVSQPALSTQLAQLESILGVTVFERGRQGVLVTQAGADIIARAKQVLLELDNFASYVGQLRDPRTGSLRMGVIPTIAPYALPYLAPTLRASYPQLRLFWREDKTAALLEALVAGSLEAALLASSHAEELEEVALRSDPFVLALPVGHRLEKKTKVLPSDLRNETVLLLEEGHCFRSQALSFCTTHRAREAEFRATSLNTLIPLVAGGAGITLLPSMATQMQQPGVVCRDFASPVPTRTIYLAWRRRSPLQELLQEIAQNIRLTWQENSESVLGL